MASVTKSIKPPSTYRGQDFTQETLNSTDASGGVNLVPAAAGKTGVIDYLLISFGAAINAELDDGTDQIVENIYGAANASVEIDGPIYGTGANSVIDLTTSGAGNITAFFRWHYEAEQTPNQSSYTGSSN